MFVELWVVMPVYNERESIERVVREWVPALRACCGAFVVCLLNDGSRDDTLAIVERLGREFPELRVIDKPNSGHGQTCIQGYRLALGARADWVLQIDSDGQCDPRFFADIWRKRCSAHAIYGFRRARGDGEHRRWVSRVVSLVGWLSLGVWVRDANVPYRLMSRQAIAEVIDQVPDELHLANVLVAILQQARFGIVWHDILFRDRHGGTPSVKPLSFLSRGWQLFEQLRRVDGGRLQGGPPSRPQTASVRNERS